MSVSSAQQSCHTAQQGLHPHWLHRCRPDRTRAPPSGLRLFQRTPVVFTVKLCDARVCPEHWGLIISCFVFLTSFFTGQKASTSAQTPPRPLLNSHSVEIKPDASSASPRGCSPRHPPAGLVLSEQTPRLPDAAALCGGGVVSGYSVTIPLRLLVCLCCSVVDAKILF